MKFQPDSLEGVNAITRQAPGEVTVNATQWRESVIVPWQGEATAWSGAHLGALLPGHFEALLAFRPEVIIFGSGPVLKFPPASLLRSLIEARVGMETMDTPAACRTYNVLVSEGRRVVAALLVAQPA